ncbi:unnamed protein product [Fraxinus pennsylvanica]|uniref:Malate synthase N-terminal domain-containing protein n=1 Tax=Fraxinus pennsylvanica TaxID=56036 RepID=A0AAD1YTY5_9LAMI|nr:unnamed protein product [Fraxinus pennsylvanica]
MSGAKKRFQIEAIVTRDAEKTWKILEFANILTRDALQFVVDLQREFRNHIKYALECRKEAKMRYNNGGLPGCDLTTKYIREEDWVCATVSSMVADQSVEMIGPVERKMIFCP